MTEIIILAVTGVAIIAAASVLGPRIKIAAPLLLLVAGIVTSYIPGAPSFDIDPELVLEVLLPPLLYASAVKMPAMDFQREFRAISGLSVMLVVVSALVVGAVFAVAVPDLGFAWGVALGAIISPTDAVATSIIKGRAIPGRVLVMLDGESLLNDATALVLLRTAIVATASSFSLIAAIGTFAYSVVVAVIIGIVVGKLNLVIRQHVASSSANTALSFCVPFIASVPAELADSSGLVAAVVAGLITGYGAPQKLSPQHRLSDNENWATVELVLEGFVFLTMGLQLRAVISDMDHDRFSPWMATGFAALALLMIVLVRAAHVGPIVILSGKRNIRGQRNQPRLQAMLDDPGAFQARVAQRHPRLAQRFNPDRMSARLRRLLADIEYFANQPLGRKDGTIVVWAGMRGAVTVAAAQTLPEDTPHRPFIIFVAFAVAGLSLVVQGLTIGPLVNRIFPSGDSDPDQDRIAEEDRSRVTALLRAVAESMNRDNYDSDQAYRIAVLAEQRNTLVDVRNDGEIDSGVLDGVMKALDAQQIAFELRGESEG